MKVALCFAQFGPYHYARAKALQQVLGEENFIAVQVASASRTYAWDVSAVGNVKPVTLCDGAEEDSGFLQVFRAALRVWKREKVSVALLPSYYPASSLALLIAAKVAGIKCIMMNESHAGTERARGVKRTIKKILISLFDGALVGGQPQLRHFANLGIRQDRIVTGYDAIDNEYFTAAAQNARMNAITHRASLGLPERYFLSLGRLVEKKNLGCLMEAYSLVKKRHGNAAPALVIVGSGDQENSLRDQCKKLGLNVIDKKSHANQMIDLSEPAVHFFGFRQIEENPIFYSLAEAFILPSIFEEWGLVVNEAMACRLPVIVSNTVGSVEDLVIDGVNGFAFDPNSSKELAEKLITLAESQELRESMGHASLERIQSWGCKNFADQAIAICSRVTS